MSTVVLKTLNYSILPHPSSLVASPPPHSLCPPHYFYELEVGAWKGKLLKPCTTQLGHLHAWPGGQMPNIPTPALPPRRPLSAHLG